MIEQIVKTLAEKLRPDRIFYYRGSLLIVVPNTTHQSLQQLKTEIEACCAGINAFNYKTIVCHELEQMLLQGHLFYSRVCASNNIVYNQSSTNVLLPLQERIGQIRENASRRFYSGLKKSSAFLHGAAFYLARKENDMAMFMIHQCTEQCLRAFILGVSEQEIRSHSLADLKQQAARYAPMLLHCLPTVSARQQQQFFLLEKSYTCARYAGSYHVDLCDIAQLYEEAGRMVELVETEFQIMLNKVL